MSFIEQEIARLEAAIADLRRQREACVNEVTAQPGRSADQLRENWINEESRRSGLRGIDQAIAGAEDQLRIYHEIAAK